MKVIDHMKLEVLEILDHRSCCQDPMRTTIKIGNLPGDMEIQAVRDIFVDIDVHILFVEILPPTTAIIHCSWTAKLKEIITNLSGYSLKCGRVLTLQLAEGDEDVRRREETRKKNQVPSCTLFVVGFDTTRISESDIAFSFSEVARVQKVMIRKSFCFVRFRDVLSSTMVMENFHGKTVLGSEISIEFSMPGVASSSTVASSSLGLEASYRLRQTNDDLDSTNENCSQALEGKRNSAHIAKSLEHKKPKSRKYCRSRSRDRHSHERYYTTLSNDRDRFPSRNEEFPYKTSSTRQSSTPQFHTCNDSHSMPLIENSPRYF